ncbi:MAG: 6-bladed beta-propeller [Planctomycetota bacterium]
MGNQFYSSGAIKMKTNAPDKLLTFLIVSGVALLLVTPGCSRPQGVIFEPLAEPLVWPDLPEVPRIAYVGSISTEEDLKPAVSWSQGLTELIFGRDDVGVLVSPTAVICDAQKMYITDSSPGVLHIFDMQSRQYKQVSALSPNERLMMPVAIAFMGQNICIADSVLKRVCVFDKEGDFKFAFGQDVLSRPTGVAFSVSNQRVYVADTANHKVNVFDEKGQWLFEFGSRGVGPGKFNFPTHLWADRDGKIYVSDTLNYRVQVFSEDGTFMTVFGIHGDRPGNFAHPAGVATDSDGHVYVVDKQYENIQIFDSEGNILMAFGTEGHGPGDFWLPAGLYICSNDRIYIADSFNKRIQVFQYLVTGGGENEI